MGATPVDEAVRTTIDDASLAGERVVSIARLVFCLANGARSIYFWAATSVTGGHTTTRAAIGMTALAIAVAFSVAVLLGAGRRRTRRVIHASVAIDAVVVFASLLPNVLWPPPDYHGLTTMMDTPSILIIIMATGLRHSASAVAFGGALNIVGFVVLSILDRRISGDAIAVHGGHYTMYAIMLGGAAAVAFLIAVRSRRLVERGARAAIAADRAGDGLRSILREHHDLRTAVTSAQLNADLAKRGSSDAIGHLQDDLGEIRVQLDRVKGRALEELAGLDEIYATQVALVATTVVEALRPRFPAIEIVAVVGDGSAALVAGGETTLRRILTNLVVNACEGDGKTVARRVDVVARRADDRVTIEVVDDGPGLPGHVAAVPPGDAASTKPDGLGVGIGLVDGLVRASGGTVGWRRGNGGGTRVVVDLRAA